MDAAADRDNDGSELEVGSFADLVRRENDILDTRFVESDILDPVELWRRLCRKNGEVGRCLGRLLRERCRRLVAADQLWRPEGKRRVRLLVDVLNAALDLRTLGAAGAPEARAEVGGVRERWRRHGEPSFLVNRLLIEREFPGLVRRWEERVPQISGPGHAQEPWVAFTAADRLGLALSGGGVRSATFNLGLLQALEAKGILGRIEYLATVSGGGYVGGFWTRWRRARAEGSPAAETAAGAFPRSPVPAAGAVAAGRPRETREPREIRHLREFSRFLIPRSGFSAEFWTAVATVLGGLLPSLVAAVVVVTGIVALWLCVGVVPYGKEACWWAPGATLAAVVAAALVGSGVQAHKLEVVEAGPAALKYWWSYAAGALLAVGMTIVALQWLPRPETRADGGEGARADGGPVAPALAAAREHHTDGVALAVGQEGVVLRWLPGQAAEPRPASPMPPWADVLRPSVALLWALGAMAVVQLGLGRFQCGRRRLMETLGSSRWSSPCSLPAAAWSLVTGRLLAVAACWTGLAGLWVLACRIVENGGAYDTGELGAGTAGVMLIFYYVRDWLRKPKEETKGSGLWEKLLSRFGGGGALKTMAARWLAIAVVVLVFLLVMVTVRWLWVPPTSDDEPVLSAPWLHVPRLLYPSAVAVACGGVLALVFLLYDPAALGMHEFYRGRITRCFLGAGRAGAAAAEPGRAGAGDGRAVVERGGDDLLLHTDAGLPLHLVCCAANQTTAEDQLVTLHRGARSVVLSRFGIAWGDHWAEARTLWLSSAITASAAAFNSLMGERSMVLGRAVSFVMTMLNLRLGLWVRNPAVRGEFPWWRSERFPGIHFLRELAGWARCTGVGNRGAYLHLSDGGHFENLALYELIRRHCRFIVVADAGADPLFNFDDFGRATRRVREDFGVELEIDLAPLKPKADGLAKQHLAVGVIHYDGVTGTDKGTIVYCKPTLTGDEPPDVLQYGRNHPAFPHEPTGDQFFDEAQFESYRRLGEHVINSALRPLERLALDPATTPDETIFWRLQLAWRGVPWMQNQDGVRLWENALKLEEELGEKNAGDWARQYLGFDGHTGSSPHVDAYREALRALRVCKFLEEAWVTCELEQYWSDSRADGWMSCLHRWAALPAVREWWPALKPLFGDDFQVFAEQQLHLPGLAATEPAADDLVVAREVQPLAARRLEQVYPEIDCLRMRAGRSAHQLVLRLPRAGGGRPLALQLGLAFVRETTELETEPRCATWAIEDLFLVPEFAVGDFHGRALDGLIGHYTGQKYSALKVVLDGPGWNKGLFGQRAQRDHASRRQHTDLIGLYRSRGFCYDMGSWRNGRCVGMVLRLAGPGPERKTRVADGRGRILILKQETHG